MRVVHIITRLILGGAQENTLLTCEELQRRYDDDVILITGPPEGPEGSLLPWARSHGIRMEVLPSLCRALRPRSDWAAYRQLVRAIRRLRPDVVHTHSSKAGIIGRAAAHRCNVPAIVHTIHGLPFHPYERLWRNAVYVRAERWAARRCHRLISVADAMTRQALLAGVGRPEQYITIYSGMDVEPFLAASSLKEEIRREYGIEQDRLVIVKVARLFEWKGHDDVIDAAANVLAEHPKALFVFVGGGVWRTRLESRISERGLSHAFRFTGIVEPDVIPRWLAASDLVVHASYREGLARVLPQALITSRPVVAYDIDGAGEVVLDGRTGRLVRPGDIQGLASAINLLLADPAMRTRMGAEGRSRFTDTFRHTTMVQSIRDVYEQRLSEVKLEPRSVRDVNT